MTNVLTSQIYFFHHRPIHHMGVAMAALRPPHNYHSNPLSSIRRRNRKVECGLRDKGLSKKPLWRTAHDMSSEAIQASRALTLASSDPQNAEAKLEHVFQTKISRLLKSDLLSLLFHLQRSDSCHLALKVFKPALPSLSSIGLKSMDDLD